MGTAEDVLTVPSRALGMPGQDSRYRLQVQGGDGTLSDRLVSVGLKDKVMAEITNGLAEGQRIVTGSSVAIRGPAACNPLAKVRWMRDRSMVQPIIQLSDIGRSDPQGEGQLTVLRDVDLTIAPGRIRSDHGRVGVGQDHADEHPGLPGPGQRRQLSPCRSGHWCPGQRPPGRAAARTVRIHLSAIPPAAGTDRAGQRGNPGGLSRQIRAGPQGTGGATARPVGHGRAAGASRQRSRGTSSSACPSPAR